MMNHAATPHSVCLIDTVMPKSDIIFLLGAGASMDAGFPNVADLTREMRKRLPRIKDETGVDCTAFRELFDFIACHDPESRNNYERFFEWISLIRRVKEHPFRKLTTLNLPPHLSEAASKLAWVIADPIRNILSECHQGPSYQPDYLTRLGEFIPKNGRLHVFTTNYDLCVEDALSGQEIDFTTGFCSETGDWSPSLLLTSGRGINLYKMHGSLNWHETDGVVGIPHEVYPPKWNKSGQPELVLGPRLKLQHDEPFVTLYSKFHKALRQAKVCVIIGCGLHDQHIRGPLKQAAWRGLHLVNVGPQVPPTGFENSMGFKNGHYHPIRSSARDALSGRIQRKLSSIFC